MTYAALEATLVDYVSGRAASTVPVARMLALTASAIRARAERVVGALSSSASLSAALRDGHSTIGGGSAPGSTIPTVLIALRHERLAAEALAAHLRHASVPIIGRIVDDHVALDLRTVPPEDDERVMATLTSIA
jgi:L-seryl-tRNA(Ser) seleniumtransferase